MATEVFPWREAPPGDYAVIGDPIGHSKSPAMHHAAYHALGLDLTYRAIYVPGGEVPEALDHLKALGYRGVNVTVPHKEAALAWGANATEIARRVGAANTLDLTDGRSHNTDVEGFQWTLGFDAWKHDRATIGSALVLGAGGSAAAVLIGLEAMCDRIVVWNRTPERAERLVAETRERGLAIPVEFEREMPHVGRFSVIVNATSASLSNLDLGIDWSTADPHSVAIDLAYGVPDAPFLKGADAAGLPTFNGREMLARQGAAAFVWWGIAPPAAPVRRRFWLPKSAELGRILQEEEIYKAMRETLD